MHQLYVIANNYLIPVVCSRSCPFDPDTPLLSPHASHWDSHCPLVNHDAISRHRGPRLCAQPARSSDPTWCLREPRVHRRDIRAERKEGSQYFKVKLSDLDSVGGQDDRSSFPTVTAKSCFGIPPVMSSLFERDDSYAFFRISVNFTLKLIKIMRGHAREWNILRAVWTFHADQAKSGYYRRMLSWRFVMKRHIFCTITEFASFVDDLPMAGKNQCRATRCTIAATLTAYKRRLFLGAYKREHDAAGKTAENCGRIEARRQIRCKHWDNGVWPVVSGILNRTLFSRTRHVPLFLVTSSSLLCFRAASAGSATSPSTSSYQHPKFVRWIQAVGRISETPACM